MADSTDSTTTNNDSPDSGHFTKETEGRIGTITTVDDARKAHHLASADPEPERDGLLTGAAHELKYGLERVEGTIANWRGHGVHPTENRALVGDEEGAENLRGAGGDREVIDDSLTDPEGQSAVKPQTTSAGAAPENAAAPRP